MCTQWAKMGLNTLANRLSTLAKQLVRETTYYGRSVIKEFVHAFSCAEIKSWIHSESLESTQEVTVALGYRLMQLLCIFCALQILACIHDWIYAC